MAQGDTVAKTRGSELLAAVPGTTGAKATALGVDRSLVSKLQTGDRGASDEIRRKCNEVYGIALEAWEAAPESNGHKLAHLAHDADALEVPKDANSSVFEKVANYLTKAGEWTGRGSIQRLAKECGVSEHAIEYAVGWVASELAAQRGSIAVNKEASIAFYRAVARKAYEDQDWKTALAAREKLDALTGVTSKAGVHDHDDQALRVAWSICAKMLQEARFADACVELRRRLLEAQSGARAEVADAA